MDSKIQQCGLYEARKEIIMKNQFIFADDMIKLKITAQPIENKANKALIEFLSKKLKVAKTNIEIVKGETSKEKTLLFKNISTDKMVEIKTLLT